MSEPLVIVGNGVAAARLCEELAQRALGRYAVAVIGEEPLRQRDDPNEPRLDFETWRALFRSTCGRYTLERAVARPF
jgi:hypothetical protein